MKFYSNQEVQDLPHTNHLYTLNTESFCIEVDPVDRKSYRAGAETAALGALTLACITTTGAVVSRKNEEFIDPAHKRFSLVYAIEGEVVISHHLGMSVLKAGEFTLMDNSHPRKMLVYNRVSLFLVSVPCQVLQRYFPMPEAVEGQTMQSPRGNAGNELAFSPLLELWEQIKSGSLREFAPSISENFLSSISRLYAACFPDLSSTAIRRIMEAKQLIEAQLGNPELTVEAIATSMGVTSRYLRSLYHGSEKLSHYILRRRLEESACQLNNVMRQHSSITAIAFQFGFNSAAHFSRAFRKHFGYTPRDFRKHNLAGFL
ncbi:MAG: helix-turn-helix domain-containing protein [Pseudomonadota bacterium]